MCGGLEGVSVVALVIVPDADLSIVVGRLSQRADEYRPVLLAVDQELGERSRCQTLRPDLNQGARLRRRESTHLGTWAHAVPKRLRKVPLTCYVPDRLKCM